MTLARPVVFGNWKMNGLRADGLALVREVARRSAGLGGTVGVFPPATLLREVADALKGTPVILGGQDCHEAKKGAFTGSLSAAMLADAGATHVILGHSERRHGLGEGDELIRAKATRALAQGLAVVLCIGETEAEWQAGQREAVLGRQIEGSLPDAVPLDRLLVAYEPVWAIGTGRTAEPSDIEATHAFVRERLVRRWQEAAGIPILYGGSVKPENARPILALASVDGALVGGASLDAASFVAILEAGAAI